MATPAGTNIDVTTDWSASDIGSRQITITRTLKVTKVAATDKAFSSEVTVPLNGIKSLADAEVFIPGLWYATSAHTQKSALITDLGQREFILREDRMALPLVSVRNRATGWTLSIGHVQPDGGTIAGDDNIAPVIDARLQYGALGIRRDESGLKFAFRFPGSEGEQTSIFGYKPDLRTAQRWHPLIVGATQTYTLTFRLSDSVNFAQQMHDVWRSAYAAAQPLVVPFDAPSVYSASINVLDHYFFTQADVAGFPFSASLPDGVVKDPSLQMGFVGQQLPCASYLIDEGIRAKRPDVRAKGEQIVDFWAKQSLSKAGVPRTWFDLKPEPHWRDYHTFLRVATDGTSGMLRAWQLERAAGTAKPEWLSFCRHVGDWLLKIQNADGSFFREYGFDGHAMSKSLTSTLHPVRLLIDLSCATGDMKYRAAALRAATLALKANADGPSYIGGTPDNPDVVDKEAGWIAFDSYLALYDVTQDKRWLDAAVDAATFTETWIYAWNVPLPIDADPAKLGVPRVKTFAGTNLIATGHSGVDNFLAFASFSYARLAIYTGDEHFAGVARLLQHNSAQFVDTGEKSGNSLGYATPGLCVEAFTLAVNRGHSVNVWLPWLTSAIVEPMARMREAFGVTDVDAMLAIEPKQREQMNAAFALTRGFAH